MPMPAVAERLGAQHAALAREPHHREVAGAAAEVGDQHGGVAVEAAREGERGADRLVDVACMTGAEPLERGACNAASASSSFGLPPAKRTGRPTMMVGAPRSNPSPACRASVRRECRQQILELVALSENLRGVEGRARGERLERLDEAVDRAPFEELLDRPQAALGARMQPGARPVLAEAQRRSRRRCGVRPAMIESDGLDTAVAIGQRNHGVAGAEIDADRDGGRGARHVLLGW